LICDLSFELTWAANYVCEEVRNSLFAGYRVKEGAVLMERHDVGFDLRSERLRLEYRGKERIKPYPGLKKFKKIRYSRKCALCPNPPEPAKRVPPKLMTASTAICGLLPILHANNLK
jgi:hypothetical protein